MLGAQQSPIDTTDAIPACASRSGSAANATAKASLGTREVTATTDSEGRLVQITEDMTSVVKTAGKVTITYSDFGTPLTVTAPPKSEVSEMPDQLKQAMSGATTTA